MVRTQVNSTILASVGYDAGKQLLEIEFHDGNVYQYSHVPESVYEGLMAAESHGRYFDQHVKKAEYPYRRIV